MSACVKWAKEHVDDFNKILARQLSSLDQDSKLWKECMDQAHDHAALLTEVGLDFKDFIGIVVESDAVDGEETNRAIGLGVSS